MTICPVVASSSSSSSSPASFSSSASLAGLAPPFLFFDAEPGLALEAGAADDTPATARSYYVSCYKLITRSLPPRSGRSTVVKQMLYS
jgi:hypothetical protein